ncbi:MAG: hypothetical protein RBS73_01785 [Prolixibacteraceae bacterium]|jgi:hypothetical protein|nr:hypothetical protein [Prolixibacteraceae bacterium]
MLKENFKNQLIKYQFKFLESEKSFRIKLGSCQEILVVFTSDNKISIEDKLTKWNPLSGILKMSLRNAMIFQSISIFLFWLLFLIVFSILKFDIEYFEFATMVLVGSWGFVIFWGTYYLIKLENFKRTLINWLDE